MMPETKKPAKIKWQAIEDREKNGLKLIFLARSTRQEIVVRVEVRNSDPLRWGEWGFPKILGLHVCINVCFLELDTKELKP